MAGRRHDSRNCARGHGGDVFGLRRASQCRGRRRYSANHGYLGKLPVSVWRGRRFPFGSSCIADAMYAPVVSRLRTYSVPVDPESAAYMDAVWTHPWMQAWGEKAADEPRVEKYEDI